MSPSDDEDSEVRLLAVPPVLWPERMEWVQARDWHVTRFPLLPDQSENAAPLHIMTREPLKE